MIKKPPEIFIVGFFDDGTVRKCDIDDKHFGDSLSLPSGDNFYLRDDLSKN